MSQPKSRFRGVYKCGKRWKAQLQSQGVQFYLGTFDTEEDAAKAYDRKARDEKGFKSQTNFDDLGNITGLSHNKSSSPNVYNIESASNENEHDVFKKVRHDDTVQDGGQPRYFTSTTTDQHMATNQVRVMWERLCQISQRVLLANVAHEKLLELQLMTPDEQKENLIRSLGDEIAMLTVVKTQLEEAISRCFSGDMNADLPFRVIGATKLTNLAATTSHNNSSSSHSSFIEPASGSLCSSSEMLPRANAAGGSVSLKQSSSSAEVNSHSAELESASAAADGESTELHCTSDAQSSHSFAQLPSLTSLKKTAKRGRGGSEIFSSGDQQPLLPAGLGMAQVGMR